MPTAIALINRLYAADQSERENHPAFGTAEYLALREADARRREELRGILAQREVNDPVALYRAAMIFQHGDDLADVYRAHELAQRAAVADYAPAKWLAAAALDRWLMYQGRPQKYGTQIVPDGRRQRVWDVEPATTDEERRAWNVSSLADMHAEAARITATEPMPPLDQAPGWLKDAIERWRRDGA